MKINLLNLSNATSQQVFDQVAKHLLTQNEICSDENLACCYRNKAGLKCAAGCLIGKSEYKKKFEKKPWDKLIELGLVSLAHNKLIIDLQILHDRTPVVSWKSELLRCANKHNLNPDILNKF